MIDNFTESNYIIIIYLKLNFIICADPENIHTPPQKGWNFLRGRGFSKTKTNVLSLIGISGGVRGLG